MTQTIEDARGTGRLASAQRGWRAVSDKDGQGSQWATVRLSDAERDILADAATGVSADMLANQAALARLARGAWNALDIGTRDRVGELAAGLSVRPELYISNVPVDPVLPPTPTTTATARSTTSFISELVMTVFATELGNPMSYADQRSGSIFHDIFPTVANASKVSSQSSLVGLGFHSEMFFHPTPPTFLILHCLRPDPAEATWTGVASLATIENSLDPMDREILRRRAFALDLARLHGSYRYQGSKIEDTSPRPCIPVIADDSLWRLRFEPALMTPLTEMSRGALDRAEHAAATTAAWGTLRSGGVLLVDNRRSAHSRSPFKAKFDGTDRWLRRMMIAPFEMPAKRGIVCSTDFDLWTPWQRLDATFDVVPYAPEEGE